MIKQPGMNYLDEALLSPREYSEQIADGGNPLTTRELLALERHDEVLERDGIIEREDIPEVDGSQQTYDSHTGTIKDL